MGEPPCVGQQGDGTGRGEWTDTPPGSPGPVGDRQGGTALAAAHSSVPQFPHCEVGGGHGGGKEGLVVVVVDAGLVGGCPPGSPSMWGAPGLLQPFPCWLGVQLSLQSFASFVHLGQHRVVGLGLGLGLGPQGCLVVPTMAAAPYMPSWSVQSIPIPCHVPVGPGQELQDPHSPKEPRLMVPLCSAVRSQHWPQSPGRLGALDLSPGCPQPGSSRSHPFGLPGKHG